MTLQRNNFILYKTIFLDFTLYVGQHKKEKGNFDAFTFAVLNITIKYKCIFEKKSCSELTLTLVLNDYRLNQTATLLLGELSQLELQAHDLINVLAVSPSCLIL